VKDFKDEYYSLTEEEKANLIEEYKEYKATKTTGQRISTKLKINDVTHTLKAVESEIRLCCLVAPAAYLSLHIWLAQ